MSDSQREELLADFSLAIAAKREEAVTARKESGIEDVWLYCEEAYLGIDDLNRSEFTGAKWAKPTSMEGPVTTAGRTSTDEVKSTAFVRLTSRYVDAGAAKVSELLLPIDDKAFSLAPTPVPDLIAQKDDLRHMIDMATGQKIMRPARPDELPEQAPPQSADQALDPAAQTPVPGAPMVPKTVKDLAEEQLGKAKDCADKAETRIYDWMSEAKYPAEARKVVFDASRIGVGVLKGPFPEIATSKALTEVEGGVALQIQKKIKPSLRWVDPWNCFPDPACGENVHEGDYFIERDYLSPRKLKELKEQKGYIKSQIDKVLKEGPGKCFAEGANPAERKNKRRYEIWYYYGTLTRKEMELANIGALDGLPDDKDDIYAIVTLVNDTVIRATINPLESGKFPYNVWSWSRRAGHWAGVGPGEQVKLPQTAVNAGTRALFNNAGISSGVQIIINQLGITPADKKWTVTPNKLWFRTGEASDDVRKDFNVLTIPNIGPALMEIIQYGFKLAEEATNIPLVTQGRDGETTPQTFGQAELQNSNAHTLLRNTAYSYDDNITEPLVDSLYEWLLLDPDVPNEEKGDFKINAHGSITMVEKAIQEQTMLQAGNLVMNPAYGINPKKWFAETWRTKRLDPRKIQYTEEEQAKLAQVPPPVAPAVAAAQVRAQSALQVEQARSQAELQQIEAEAAHEQQLLQSGGTTPHMARATASIEQARIRAHSAELVEASRAHAEAARADKELQIATQNGNFKLQEMQLQRDLAVLEYSAKHNLTLEQVKAELAKTAMQEETKRQLAATEQALAASEGDKNRLLDVHKHHNPPPSLVRDEMSTPETP
jgi:hypothetical protein